MKAREAKLIIKVKELPQTFHDALAAVGYGRADIEVRAALEVQLGQGGGFKGRRHFVVIVNLATGVFEVSWGSWGGSNPFESRPADVDELMYKLPPNGAVILGSAGGNQPTWGYIVVAPGTFAPLLQAPMEDLPGPERIVLATMVGLKPGYRREAWRRAGLSDDVADKALGMLVAKGLVKRNSAGATQITTEGKNAIAPFRSGGAVKMPDGSLVYY